MKRINNEIRESVRQADDCSSRYQSEKVEMKPHIALMKNFLSQDEKGNF